MKESDIETIEKTLNIINGKWKIRILLTLDQKPLGFTELSNKIKEISNKVLSNNLEKLEEDQLITKSRKKYEATELGQDYIEILYKAREWGFKHLSDQSHLNVLIIEDDDRQAELYRRWMDHNCNVISVNKLSEAFNILEEDFDLIILDMNLGDGSGAKVLDIKHKLGAYLAVASGMEEIEGQKLEKADQFIQKPVSRSDIESLLTNLRRQRVN